ncbi:hypothetical protein F511_35527 [Dorcoceras hygrometricum]|uniref:Uncharacterized protein n=1 Tax=Dorcoceras hygrometricum TaxID=472368 RepID=A0A2Z7D9K6_9LAMI|nr:hypothetical protein F511_35527 [Dorcoceras hygrometricum]
MRRIRSCQNPSDLLVQIDGGFAFPIVDLIRRSTTVYLLKCRFPCETGRSQAPRRQQEKNFLLQDAGRRRVRRRPLACAQPCAGLRNLLRKGRPPCAGVAHGDAQAVPCMARPCAARYVVAAAAVRRCSWQRCDG